MATLKLQLLGTFNLCSADGGNIKIPSKKARALLAYLAIKNGRPVSRATLGELFWSRHDDQQALTNLRQALSILHRDIEPLAPDWLIRDSGTLAINPDCFNADVYTSGAKSYPKEIDGLKILVDNYRGSFLEGPSFSEHRLMEWVEGQRHYFEICHIEQLRLLLRLEIGDSRFSEARLTAENIVRLDALDEGTHRQLMQIYSALGQRHRVLRQYQRCCQVLELNDIGAPEEETTSLFQSLYHSTIVQPVFKTRPESLREPESVDIHSSPAIAVLPFNEIFTISEEYSLNTALTEEIIHELRRYHGFKVISALSSQSLKGQNLSLHAAANLLGARYLISGSIRKHQQRIQITVELVDAANGELIWAERYDRQIEDLLVLQSELARDIAGAIEPEAVGHAYLLSSRKSPSSLSAWDLVLRGDHQLFLQIGTRWNSDKAQHLYQKAIDLAPDYASAYAGYAYSLCLELKEGIAKDTEAVKKTMLEMAQHGAALDPDNPWCMVVLGRALQQSRQYGPAILAYKKAVELCPSSSKAHFGLGFGLASTGQYDQAISALDRAIELSPRDPMSWSFHTVKALTYLYAEKFELAEKSSTISTSNPGANHWAPALHAPSLVHLGRYDDALKALQCAKKLKPGLSLGIVESAFSVEDDNHALSVREGLIEAGLSEH